MSPACEDKFIDLSVHKLIFSMFDMYLLNIISYDIFEDLCMYMNVYTCASTIFLHTHSFVYT